MDPENGAFHEGPTYTNSRPYHDETGEETFLNTLVGDFTAHQVSVAVVVAGAATALETPLRPYTPCTLGHALPFDINNHVRHPFPVATAHLLFAFAPVYVKQKKTTQGGWRTLTTPVLAPFPTEFLLAFLNTPGQAPPPTLPLFLRPRPRLRIIPTYDELQAPVLRVHASCIKT